LAPPRSDQSPALPCARHSGAGATDR
jgi:hypothetical protein